MWRSPFRQCSKAGRGQVLPAPTHPNTVVLGAAGVVAVGVLGSGPHPLDGMLGSRWKPVWTGSVQDGTRAACQRPDASITE